MPDRLALPSDQSSPTVSVQASSDEHCLFSTFVAHPSVTLAGLLHKFYLVEVCLLWQVLSSQGALTLLNAMFVRLLKNILNSSCTVCHACLSNTLTTQIYTKKTSAETKMGKQVHVMSGAQIVTITSDIHVRLRQQRCRISGYCFIHPLTAVWFSSIN